MKYVIDAVTLVEGADWHVTGIVGRMTQSYWFEARAIVKGPKRIAIRVTLRTMGGVEIPASAMGEVMQGFAKAVAANFRVGRMVRDRARKGA